MAYVTRRQRAEKRRKRLKTAGVVIAAAAFLALVAVIVVNRPVTVSGGAWEKLGFPPYAGEVCVAVNGDVPFFEAGDPDTVPFERYSDLDALGRCGTAFANVCRELMPSEERGEIGGVRPSGWNQARYPGIVDSSPPYLFNRCHLIAFCLTGENDNEKNLITGTRYMNFEAMRPLEQKVAAYLGRYDRHVLYRVTPVFYGVELVARGVLVEAYSVEDGGRGICFCRYCYNVQPGVTIDYLTGESRASA